VLQRGILDLLLLQPEPSQFCWFINPWTIYGTGLQPPRVMVMVPVLVMDFSPGPPCANGGGLLVIIYLCIYLCMYGWMSDGWMDVCYIVRSSLVLAQMLDATLQGISRTCTDPCCYVIGSSLVLAQTVDVALQDLLLYTSRQLMQRYKKI
jgi:hypothetical protein